jgi:addiction module RelE/StbE family toxin
MRTTSRTAKFKKDYKRECHLKPDLLLVYKKPDDETLRLVRLGSHSELF